MLARVERFSFFSFVIYTRAFDPSGLQSVGNLSSGGGAKVCRGASEIFLYAQIVRPIICMHACSCACRRVRAIGDRERVHNFPFRSQTCARDASVCEGISRSFLCICTGDEIQNVCSLVLHTCARHNIIVCALHVSAERRNNKHLLLVSLCVCVCVFCWLVCGFNI